MARFGKMIRRVRLDRKMTATELAKRIAVVNSYICKIEVHHEIPSNRMLIRLAMVLRLDLNYVLSVMKADILEREEAKINQRIKAVRDRFEALA